MLVPDKAHLYKHLKDTDEKWIVRWDIWVRFRVKDGIEKGKLTIVIHRISR
ncbi:MAG: hypothetical protein VCF25_11360 [Candidatus Poribacteria bacterium]